jgi:hypothetical protein
MFTLCIRYTINPDKLADFAAYAKGLATPIARCGGTLRGYFLPTKFAGPTNVALALIDFADLAAYEAYRVKLGRDEENVANARRVETAGAILVEDRSFMQPVE